MEFQMDHAYLEQCVFLSLYCMRYKAGGATMAPTKGVHDFIVRWCIRRMEDFEAKDVRLRTDSDASVCAIAARIKAARKDRTRCESTPIRSSQSLGGVERFHRTIEEQCRVLKLELEARFGSELALDIGFGSWLLRHAAWLVYRFHVPRETGKSGFAQMCGRNYESSLV